MLYTVCSHLPTFPLTTFARLPVDVSATTACVTQRKHIQPILYRKDSNFTF